MEEEQKRVLRERDLQMNACQEAVTKVLVIEERNELLSKQIESKDIRIRQMNVELEQTKQ